MICKVVAEKTVEQSVDKLEGFCEWRLDYLERIDVAKIRDAIAGRQVILTIRPEWEGGNFRDEEKRVKFLRELLDLNPAYLDIELECEAIGEITRIAGERGIHTIVSYHNFSETPSLHVLHSLVKNARQYNPTIIKIVTLATSLRDNLVILQLNVEAESKIVAFCMGACGKMSRIFCSFFGSEFTYGGSIAPGQVSVEDLETIFSIIGEGND
ncbi:MAG: type I 3-dehydroquinate dehydratase [Theionarchaea archaeon]|nr:type I 3-dehydroquinate dehydratase [Theionarchaea archaeon]